MTLFMTLAIALIMVPIAVLIIFIMYRLLRRGTDGEDLADWG